MAQRRDDSQRRARSIARWAIILGACLGLILSCADHNPAATGWLVDGTKVSTDAGHGTIPQDATFAIFTVTLPENFEAASGFVQKATVSVEGDETGYVLGDLTGSPSIALPNATSFEITILLGFCPVDDKERCYVQSSTIALTRSSHVPSASAVRIAYTPEVPE